MNAFQIFNLTPDFEIDLENLAKLHQEAQLKFHPDNAKSSKEYVEFTQKFEQFTEAYDTLKSDVERANELLYITSGVSLKSADTEPLKSQISPFLSSLSLKLFELLEEDNKPKILLQYQSVKSDLQDAFKNNTNSTEILKLIIHLKMLRNGL